MRSKLVHTTNQRERKSSFKFVVYQGDFEEMSLSPEDQQQLRMCELSPLLSMKAYGLYLILAAIERRRSFAREATVN